MAEVKSIQDDNEVFCSVYRKDYVFWKEYDHRTRAIHDDYYRLTPEMAEEFLQVEIKPDYSKMEQYLEDMKELNRLRLRTLYSVEYCPKASYRILRSDDPEKFSPKNDKFLIDGSVKFGVAQGKVLPPLPSARRVLAYSPYDDYRTPLSTYQDIHGRLGYDRVKQAADEGYCRMGPRYDHEKEMAEIRNVLRREGDISQREKEEKLLEEEMMKKQMEKEREVMIKKALEKRNRRRGGTEIAARFGPDPRQKSPGSFTVREDAEARRESSGKPCCGHSKEQHDACAKKKATLTPLKTCNHSEREHEQCQNKLGAFYVYHRHSEREIHLVYMGRCQNKYQSCRYLKEALGSPCSSRCT